MTTKIVVPNGDTILATQFLRRNAQAMVLTLNADTRSRLAGIARQVITAKTKYNEALVNSQREFELLFGKPLP